MHRYSYGKIGAIVLFCLCMLTVAIPNFLSPATHARYAAYLPNAKLQLGLDLRGGAQMLIEVDQAAYLKDNMANVKDLLRNELRSRGVKYSKLTSDAVSVNITLREEPSISTPVDAAVESAAAFQQAVHALALDFDVIRQDNHYSLHYTSGYLQNLTRHLVDQSIEIIRRRIDETGTLEPTIQRQGEGRILLQVPGIEDPAHLKSLLGQTAKLSFHLVDITQNRQQPIAKPGVMVLSGNDHASHTIPPTPPSRYPVKRQALLTGEMLIDARTVFNDGKPAVSFKLNSEGARRFAQVTQQYTGQPFAIVLDNTVISAPVIREPILGGSGIISGNFSVEQSEELAILLRAGALPAPLKIIEERLVGPSLGSDSIASGLKAATVAAALVVLFMVGTYHISGVFATIALCINMMLIIAVLTLLGAILTMPGIAAIILTLGMAVDANVLIFERIREELRSGVPTLTAAERGFKHAYRAITDSNITTLIVALLLYGFGTGPIKGFAVSFSVGVLTSMFSAITLTQMMLTVWLRKQKKPVLHL